MIESIIRFEVSRHALINEDCPIGTCKVETKDNIVSEMFLNPIVGLVSEMILG